MTNDILCFSHLRWNFVYQRPQHLMSLLGRNSRVFFIEEPVTAGNAASPDFDSYDDPEANVKVIVPRLPADLDGHARILAQQSLLAGILRQYGIVDYIAWYYSPMAVAFTTDLTPEYTVFDCMDELSAFLFAPPELRRNEELLLSKADIVFTGGKSLYAAKRNRHANIHCFPSSIDKAHFHSARKTRPDPEDQRDIPHPRIGFYGVIDERLDKELLDGIAAARPEYAYILIGPVVKIDPATLPRRSNIYYLGAKHYSLLPTYLAGWDIAMMPFALNASTRFISPTKTPEYLAGGKPVIAPSITDILHPYGEQGLVAIADTVTEFIREADNLIRDGVSPGWQQRVDQFLSAQSWENTVAEMTALMEQGMEKKDSKAKKRKSYV